MFFVIKLISKAVSALISLILLALAATAGFVYYFSMADQRAKTDAIVVLGAAQFNGTPSPVFANRLDHAAQLYDGGVAPLVITVGSKQPGDRYTEAAAGRTYLMSKGIKGSRVIAVPQGGDTFQSLRAIKVVLDKKQLHSITVVSDPLHVARVKMISESMGLNVRVSPTQSGPGSTFEFNYLVREVGGIVHYWALDHWGFTS